MKYIRTGKHIERLLQEIPRCRICGDALIVTCDRSQPSELVEYIGQGWTKRNPTLMHQYPTAKKQSDLCSYHQNQYFYHRTQYKTARRKIKRIHYAFS